MSDLNQGAGVNVDVVDAVDGALTGTEINRSGVDDATSNIRMIPFNKIKYDFARNPRMDDAYSPEKLAWLVRSLNAQGLKEPLVVSERPDGTFVGLKGHIRISG